MRGWTWAVLLLVMTAFLSAGNEPVPETTPPPPAIQLHRATVAKYFDPAKTNPLFVLAIGSDIRAGDPRGGRADAIQLIALDTKRGQGTIVGIPRDSYVPIPGQGTGKITSALYFGGPERVVAAVSQLSGIKIHYYAIVEFTRFAALVDALGGVRINVPYKMADPFSGAFFEAGSMHMDGGQALAFARNRKGAPGGDFGRSANQGRLLVAGVAKFTRQASNPLTLGRYLKAFHTYVVTDVPTGELINLAQIGRRIDPKKMKSLVLPGTAGSAGGASVVHLSPGARDIFAKIGKDAVL